MNEVNDLGCDDDLPPSETRGHYIKRGGQYHETME